MSDHPADRDGMFNDARLMAVGNSRDELPTLISIVTCTWCGSLVADTEAHQQMHATMVTRGFEIPVQQTKEDRFTTTEHDAGLFERRRGQARE